MSSDSVEFKFRFVVAGDAKGLFRSWKGVVGRDSLRLSDSVIPYAAVGETVVRGDRLLIQIHASALEGTAGHYLNESAVVLLPVGIQAARLEGLIDERVASFRLARRREVAQQQGLAHLVRSAACPTCEAEIDLSDVDDGPWIYCPYCDTLFDAKGAQSLGRDYRVCDECGYYGHVKSYPEFYFYWLVIFYGFSFTRRFLCTSCAHELFKRALLRNLIFVVGVPTAIWVKVKSLIGVSPGIGELSRATGLARKGNLNQARAIFEDIQGQYPGHPGALMNEGLARLQHGDEVGGAERIAQALDSCPNYYPVHRLLGE